MASERFVVPIGEHSVRVPTGVDPAGPLDGTRVWVRQTGERIVVHLGDVEPGSLD